MTLHFKYNELFAVWRMSSAEALEQGFRKHLEAADTVLMEFADKAENLNIQNHFFDAQREIWLKMEDMTLDFQHLLEKQMDKSPAKKSKKAESTDEATLDLLNLDIYEKNLALKTLAEKSEIENAHELYALRQRLTVIHGGIPVDLESVPAAPTHICNVFSRSIERLTLENDAFMVLYTLFDKYVMSLLPDIYHELNQQLIDIGILPSLKYQLKTAADMGLPPKLEAEQQTQQPAAAETPATDAGEGTASQSASELGDETLLRIRDLLSINRARTHPRAPLPAGVKAATDQEIINTVSVIPEDRETAMPTEVQIGKPVDDLHINAELLSRIQDSLASQRNKVKRKVGRDRISDQQEDVIDVVGMLFEQMLDHEGLPGVVKALLGHLHTPYIKIGVQDESFFGDQGHPAREFLNQAIDAAISWTDERDLNQGVYPLLRNTVHQIVKFRRQAQSDFVEFQDQLANEIERLSAKSKMMESRSQETEKGKAHLDRSKAAAQQATEAIFAGEQITDDCKRFVDEVWVDFLTLILLRNQGQQDTAEWLASQNLGKQLLALSQRAATSQADAAEIEDLHQLLKKQVGNLLPHQTKAIERFIHSLKLTQQTTAVIQAKTKTREESPAAVEAPDLALQQKLRELPTNTWFQFELDTKQSNRAKLSWYNKHTDRLLFVDQAGKKVCLKSIAELVSEINQGSTAYFVETKHSFWDTAMSAIRRLLEKPIKK